MHLFNHFYNENYLLPWWCQHHREIFHSGFLLDQHSTDNSVDIIKSICPEWQIELTQDKFFYILPIDQRIMDEEVKMTGFKMALTNAEFLVATESFKKKLSTTKDETMFVLMRLMAVDPYPEIIPSYDKPLTSQKSVIIYEKYPGAGGPYRLIHNYPHGAYTAGKHFTRLTNRNLVYIPPEQACVVHYHSSPWTPEFIARKESFRKQIPQDELNRGHGVQYPDFTKDKMAALRQELLGRKLASFTLEEDNIRYSFL